MWTTASTTAALVEARNTGRPLAAVKSDSSAAPAPEPPAGGGAGAALKVGQVLEGLGAVIPTGLTALYTLAATALQAAAVNDAKAEAADLAAMLTKDGKSSDDVRKALEALPTESDHLLVVRWALLVLVGLVAVVVSIRAAQQGAKKASKVSGRVEGRVLAPSTALVAFVFWALASPGTPLGHYQDASDMLVSSTVIAVAGAVILYGLGTAIITPKPQTEQAPGEPRGPVGDTQPG